METVLKSHVGEMDEEVDSKPILDNINLSAKYTNDSIDIQDKCNNESKSLLLAFSQSSATPIEAKCSKCENDNFSKNNLLQDIKSVHLRHILLLNLRNNLKLLHSKILSKNSHFLLKHQEKGLIHILVLNKRVKKGRSIWRLL